MSKLEVLITSGGTISKVDDVRNLGNFSGGTTGALIAEEFLRKNHKVHFLYAKNSVKPFKRSLQVDVNRPLEQELDRVSKVHREFSGYRESYQEYQYETFEEYQSLLESLVKGKDVVVLAAAVSDYGAKKQGGKISSDKDTLTLELVKYPKLISLVKQWNPQVFQVGFKLLSNVTAQELIETAYQHGMKNHSNLTVANTLPGKDFRKTVTYVLTPEKSITPVKRHELAKKLVDTVEQRVSKRHYSTEITTENPQLAEEKIKFKEELNKLYKFNLFENYYPGSHAQFGFYAKRLNSGFLITSRASNKESIALDEIVYVEKVDEKSRKLYVQGKKASLNANTVARIFKEQPEVSLALHSHISLGLKTKTDTDFSPGTLEDEEEVIEKLRYSDSVELKNHGIILLGNSLDELIKHLGEGHAYQKYPEFYELVYKRFHNSKFTDFVENYSGKEEKLLDLACGTGLLAEDLRQRGYNNISLADKNQGMLDIARRKLSFPSYVAYMESLDLGKFDVITVRQALNYLMSYESLVKAFKSFNRNLSSGGRLMFNSPIPGNPRDKKLEYGTEDFHVTLSEMNFLENNILTHTQNATLTKKDGTQVRKLYDLNRFAIYTTEQYQSALSESGFSPEFTQNGSSLYVLARKNN